MTKSLKNFILNLSKLTFILAVIYFVGFYFINKSLFLPVYILIIGFIYILTIIVHYFLLKSSEDRIARFSANFMMTTTFKLLIYIIFLVGYLLLHKENGVKFAVFFLFNYLVYTIFEVYSILKHIRASEKK